MNLGPALKKIITHEMVVGNGIPPNFSNLRPAFLHSTPISNRKRSAQCHWNPRFNCSAKRTRRRLAKQALWRNASTYAESLFESWKAKDDKNKQSSSRWFKKQNWGNGTKRVYNGPWESQSESSHGHGTFRFVCSDDEEVETIFQFVFGGQTHFTWFSSSAKQTYWRNSYQNFNHRSSSNWRYTENDGDITDDEDDTTPGSYNSQKPLASHRQTLGLRLSGPLKLEEIKSAYRACALKWHPDRHEGPSKAIAEERFKLCSAAYTSLCDELAMA